MVYGEKLEGMKKKWKRERVEKRKERRNKEKREREMQKSWCLERKCGILREN